MLARRAAFAVALALAAGAARAQIVAIEASQQPTCTNGSPLALFIVDADDASDCDNSGGGSVEALCCCTDGAWDVCAAEGGAAGTGFPYSLDFPPETPGAYDDEFEDTTLSGDWTFSGTATTPTTGTVLPIQNVTGTPIYDLTTWPGWFLLQSDDALSETINMRKTVSLGTDATFFVKIAIDSLNMATTAEGNIHFALTNSGDSNESVFIGLNRSSSGYQYNCGIQNNGNFTGTIAGSFDTTTFPHRGAIYFLTYKTGNVYVHFVGGDGGQFKRCATVTKTGVTTFDRWGVEFVTSNDTPSLWWGVDFFRYKDSNTFAIKNPAPDGGAGGGLLSVWGCDAGACDTIEAAAGHSLDAGDADAVSPATRSTSLPGTCTEGQQHQDTDSGGTETYTCTAPDTWTKHTAPTDNVATATALAANGANCAVGEWAAGVDASGAAEGCTADDDVPEAADFGALSASAPITQSGGTISTSIATGRLVGRTTASAGPMEEITPDATLALSAGALGVVDVTCTGCLGPTEIAGLDAGDTTSGTFSDARIDGSQEADEVTLAGDTDGPANANDLDEAAVEPELEGALDLPDLQGVLTVAKGGTGAAPGGDDQVAISDSGSAATWRTIPDCSNGTTSKLLYTQSSNTISCGTDQTGGGGGANVLEVSIALSGGSGYFSTTVTGQAWVSSSSKIVCGVFGTTADGLTPEAVAIGGLVPTVANRVAGVGFDLLVYSPNGLTGTVRFHCTGA